MGDIEFSMLSKGECENERQMKRERKNPNNLHLVAPNAWSLQYFLSSVGDIKEGNFDLKTEFELNE